MDRYNFLKVEKKWRDNPIASSVINSKSEKKYYCFRNVSLPLGKNTYGPRKKLYYWRCNRSL